MPDPLTGFSMDELLKRASADEIGLNYRAWVPAIVSHRVM